MEASKVRRETVLMTDVAVVGAGGTGLVAALTAAEGSAKVILFEKNSTAGGAAGFASGPFAVQSRMQRQKYIGLTRDEAFMRIMDYSHWRADARLVRAYVDKSAGTIDWLEQQGVEFVEPLAMVLGGEYTWHVIKGRGAAMVKALVAKIEDKGVDMRLSTPVKKLIKDGNRISGIIAEDKSGKTVHVNARAVIIGTGGYGSSREMVKKYTGFDLGVNLVLPPPGDLLKSTGEGILMAWEAGGAIDDKMGLIEMNFSVPKLGSGDTQLVGLMRQPYLWVNQQGKRFFNEGIGNYPFRGNALAGQKGGYAYLIIDGNTKKYLEQEGLDTGAGLVFAGTKLMDLDEDFRKAINNGNENVFMTDSIGELGKKIGILPHVLKRTVNEYNGFCEKGHDDLFAKNPRYLRPVKDPAFYALRIFPQFLGTIGGIRINDRMEVLDGNGEPIPGLYAGGYDATGGLYGDTYNLFLPGGSLGFALNSGRIAAENALKYIRTKRTRTESRKIKKGGGKQ